MSGIFFGGTPGRIVDAWRERRVAFVLSPSIVDEYRRVGEELESKYGDFGMSSILAVLVANSEFVDAPDLEPGISRDPGMTSSLHADWQRTSLSSYRAIAIYDPLARGVASASCHRASSWMDTSLLTRPDKGVRIR